LREICKNYGDKRCRFVVINLRNVFAALPIQKENCPFCKARTEQASDSNVAITMKTGLAFSQMITANLKSYCLMYIPEYTITNEILNNISGIGYAKAIIETTTILPNWEKQLVKDARLRTIQFGLELEGNTIPPNTIKKYLDGIETNPPLEIKNYNEALNHVRMLSKSNTLTENTIKNLHILLSDNMMTKTKQGVYRSTKINNTIDPEELLAEMVEFLDWYKSPDAKETQSIITAGIVRGYFEILHPFEHANSLVANLVTKLTLMTHRAAMKRYLCLEEFYSQNTLFFEQAIQSIKENDGDLTLWIEYFTQGFLHEMTKIKEKVLLLAKDTKVAKVTGRVKLTTRQERIVEYLQDYGILQNKDFPKLFPSKSEDTVLRDLKGLIDHGIVVKRGKTKSSRYELK
jgi:Fic family protein